MDPTCQLDVTDTEVFEAQVLDYHGVPNAGDLEAPWTVVDTTKFEAFGGRVGISWERA